jgi:hypothetical protein
MDVGDALIYPTCGGNNWNPYTTRRDRLNIYGPRGGEAWRQDGWGAMVIVDRGRAFGFFAWYRPIVIRGGLTEMPDLTTLGRADWQLELPGTCSRSHFRRMMIEKVGTVPVDSGALHSLYPGLKPGDRYAISDISIANRMKVSAVDKRFLQSGARAGVIRLDALREG